MISDLLNANSKRLQAVRHACDMAYVSWLSAPDKSDELCTWLGYGQNAISFMDKNFQNDGQQANLHSDCEGRLLCSN